LGDFSRLWGVFGHGPSNAANFIFPRPTFEIKLFDFFTGLNNR